MIHLEDGELAAFAMHNGEIAVPMEIYLPAEATESEITVYPRFEPLARRLEKAYRGRLFTEDAVSFVLDALHAPMEAGGFEPSPDIRRTIREFSLTNAASLRTDVILPDTRLIREGEALPPLPAALTQPPEAEDAPFALQTADGQIVACAALNDCMADEAGAEVHVECAPGWRGRGYAASCTACLAKHLLSAGETVLYRVWEQNRASLRVAEKVGFQETGCRHSFVYYRWNS